MIDFLHGRITVRMNSCQPLKNFLTQNHLKIIVTERPYHYYYHSIRVWRPRWFRLLFFKKCFVAEFKHDELPVFNILESVEHGYGLDIREAVEDLCLRNMGKFISLPNASRIEIPELVDISAYVPRRV